MAADVARQADDTDGRPRRAAELAEQVERLTLGAPESQVGDDDGHAQAIRRFSASAVIP